MVTTHVDRARDRIDAERDAVEAKQAAFDSFVDRVEELSPAPSTTGAVATAANGLLARTSSPNDDGCAAVRSAFAETVRPHSVDDLDDPEPLLETIRSELSDSIAVALAPTTDTTLSPGLVELIVSEARKRRAEAAVFRRALDREAAQLAAAADVVDEITGWIVEADERPLSELGFDALRRRHERLASDRDRCEALAMDRQAFLQGTTSEGAELGVRHRHILEYCYQDFPIDHPVLVTVVRLDDVCADCQRAVRKHLVRRC
ncbi:hypothetical protein GCM10028857_24000 [Salinarchaeum chitinilyticum]